MGRKRTFEFMGNLSALDGDYLMVEIDGYNKNDNIYVSLPDGLAITENKKSRGDYYRNHVHNRIQEGKFLKKEIRIEDIKQIIVHTGENYIEHFNY